MQEKIIWFVLGYIYCIIVTYIMNYKKVKRRKKKVKKYDVNN